MAGDKLKLVRVTDPTDIDIIIGGDLSAPAALGGNTFDGLLVDADEYRTWKSLSPDGEGKS